ncbi:Gfo/Idh/MocA family oxidoreductase [Leifsonia sp. F6_8S_P_1B]|uniref:Gfo/Idh/MocA family oxidoreductase n=1 Tax=Leifsonia williamsii TaxID=3035919 RepID=A0ABT8KBM2_9MICO|nr:Gfo/Idh/MocA family oxidoreductase [Leifsonia williamsii]MDN4614206.1 Gfo/Idh/MocA family oxidoreductase [Leifsonia williamsii]
MTSTLPSPRHPDPADAPALRWGVLGPGGIAADFTDALHRHTGQRVVACGSRSAERARVFAEAHGVERAYGSYEELVADAEVDVVYVASPHSEHLEHALLAIAAGKHVLVEKPIAPTAAQARAIVEAARRAGVFAMEAMWTRYLPQTDIARQLLDDGALGELRVVTADFGGSAAYDPESRLWNPALAGGALLDLGVYVVSFASFALGTPASIIATGSLAPTGVDEQASLLLGTAGGAQALLSTGLRAATPGLATICGSEARIEFAAPFWGPSGLRLHPADGSAPLAWTDPYGRPHRDGMSYEAAALARYVAEGRAESPLHPLAEVVSTMETLDEARRQLGATAVV